MKIRNLLVTVLTICAPIPFFLPSTVQAQQDVGLSSRYTPYSGTPFFVLTDSQYGTSDESLLRVEVDPWGGRQAIAENSGIDIALYRVPDPLTFLKAQDNPHRINVQARPRNEGVANTLSYLWANAWNKSRRAWRDLFTKDAKLTVTETVPDLKTREAKPHYRPASRFKPLEGFELAKRFTYPLMYANAIDPQKANVHLAGSSSNFIPKNDGNFYVPLGKLRPGLYVAEAMLGSYRAVTLVFVSDTIAITKLSSGTLTAWAVHRAEGRPVQGAQIQWTDGRGVLASGATDANGLVTLAHASPERTYLLGLDSAGGVFVSENFYYDSEIYDTKLYTVTDRPLYRPGDEVQVKFTGCEYRAAHLSQPAKEGKLSVSVLDPNGTPVWSGEARFLPDRGGNTSFRLPPDATAGGYEIRTQYQDKTYGAAFRVAEYIKPHMEITVTPNKPDFKTGENVSGTLRLTYPNGDPVKQAAVDLTLRAQVLTMVQGELRYGGLFPVQVTTNSLTTDDNGKAEFSLPPAKEPSRYIITALATDGAAYRVRKTSELLVERAAANWKLVGSRKFSMPGEALVLRLEPESPDSEKTAPPAQWEIIRLENQAKSSGPFDPNAREWQPKLEQPGSYSLILRDAKGNIVAAAPHWVGGKDKDAHEIETIPGTIEMVTNKERYQAGETAEILMTFSAPVDEALLTLERDRVENHALLSAAHAHNADWIRAERLAPNQWRAHVPVLENHAPNITFSVAYVKNGEYVFQNAGLVVETPRLALDIKPSKNVSLPGETVDVDINVSLGGQPARAALTISVVDEMVYALQPEIAPDIVEFFQHVRRNNVRTGASLNFITYDEAFNYAEDAARQSPARHQYNERGIKVLERARRDDTDTAAWIPVLMTDANGRAKFSFKMPDALSRWRITVRAVALDEAKPAGKDTAYGQRAAWMQSDKPLYAKWTSPDWMREGDSPLVSLAIFNHSNETRDADITLKLGTQDLTQRVSLARGVSYLPFKLPPFNGSLDARLEIHANGQLIDSLETPLEAMPAVWRGLGEQAIQLDHGIATLPLPNDAKRLRVRFAASGSEHFLRIADSLLEYPWGCVEQTSSRLIPLAIITPLLSTDKALGKTAQLRQILYSQRLRLASMAGPQAVFGWWGNGTGNNALMTAYAYYADWLAAKTLGVSLPASHWERVLAVYSEHAQDEPILHRALALWFIQQIGLPVRTQTEGLLSALAKTENGAKENSNSDDNASPLLAGPGSPLGLAYARALAALIAQDAGMPSRKDTEMLNKAWQMLESSQQPSAQALFLLGKGGNNRETAAASILGNVSESTPTLDRALALVWTRQALGGKFSVNTNESRLKPVGEKWQTATQPSALFDGQAEWRWPSDERLPDSVRVSNAPARLTAIARYETDELPVKSALPVTLTRTLYRLERQEFKDGVSRYKAVKADPAAGLSTHELYLDEITLTAEKNMRFGLAEVPLPPGASIEASTWGISLIEEGGEHPIDRSNAQEHRDRYGIPIETLSPGQPVVQRHLLRVAQTGKFTLPPARYYRMYQPEKKAYSGEKNEIWMVK
ncbi:MAG: alpha-2-macroglobulin family protein [Azoarcus sp.]|jgi:uncharacterized protein YfaS (alpha-2-macroglobulin family)|nr:alpha-2-macroglobulin family protein [Azoarcus sp.]